MSRPWSSTHDAVGLLHGGKAMRNDKAGAVRAKVFERLLHEAFGAVVECGGRFIEQEQRRIFEQGACDREPLFFTTGKASAALTGDGVQAIRIARTNSAAFAASKCGPEVSFGGIVFREQEIFAQRGVEKETFLSDISELVAQPFFGNVLKRYTIDEDASPLGS
jgi:hypothetical protein